MTEIRAESPPSPPTVPALPAELRCPLCGYDLRAATEPRCPECGYRFSWNELTDPSLRAHPFLFEHHLHDGWRHFWRTAVAGLRPNAFWKQLFPTQPSRPRRLVWYWFLAALPLLTMYLVAGLAAGIPIAQRSAADRAAHAAGTLTMSRYDILNYPSTEAFLEATAPVPPSRTFFRAVLHHPVMYRLVVASLSWLLWPWLTFAALMIFQVSMRRARVKVIHVLRCALYAGDLVLWAALAIPLIVAGAAWSTWTGGYGWEWWIAIPVRLLQLSLIVLYIRRLIVAYSEYLRFDHAAATVLASQVIAYLLWLVVLARVLQ